MTDTKYRPNIGALPLLARKNGQDARATRQNGCRAIRGRQRRGMVLIIVLVVVVALSLGALAFSGLMMGERDMAHSTGRQLQATAFAESGVESLRLAIGDSPDVQYGEGTWYVDYEKFRAIVVSDDEMPRWRGRFSIVASGQTDESGELRFGVICESAKLNLNTLLATSKDGATARERLMVIPEMTEEIADAILDWLDEDDKPREFGAESEVYGTYAPPYNATNGPMACLEELLFVRGVTPELLYGADRNRNGRIDGDETIISSDMPLGGWSDYLTVSSREGIRQSDGTPKINLNQSDAETLHAELEEVFDVDWANFIVAYRQQESSNSNSSNNSNNSESNGSDNASSDASSDQKKEESSSSGKNGRSSDSENSTSKTSGGNTDNSSTVQVEKVDRVPQDLDLTKPLKREIKSIFDLIDASVQISYDDGKRLVEVEPLFKKESSEMREYLPILMSHATTGKEETLSGRVNVNLAPVEVLATVPGIDETLAEEIAMSRPSDPTTMEDYQRDATWLLVDELVTLDQMKTLLPYLTAGGSVYRAQSVGFFDEGGPIVRIEAILDASESPPSVLSLRNLGSLGPGFDASDLGAEP